MLQEIKPLSTIDAVIEVPGSKSYTNRALVVATLADGISYLERCLLSDDTRHMIQALQQIGIPIIQEGENITVMGRAGRIGRCKNPLFAGNAGTTFRFLTSLLALGHGKYILDGDERMRQRPIEDLIHALDQLQVKTSYELHPGCPPIAIYANGIPGGKAEISGKNSSQYISSLLMVAPYAQAPIELVVEGNLVSSPYIHMTLDMMQAFGVKVIIKDNQTFRIQAPQKYKPCHYTIEGDASNASYFFAAAAITGGKVRVKRLPNTTRQGDIHLVDLLTQMGCSVQKGTDWIELIGTPHLQAIEADLKDMPDMVQTLAIVALFAKGRTMIKNIAHLKIKETNRLEALRAELSKIGADVQAGDDYLGVATGNLTGSPIKTYNDHRMAMSFAVAGLRIPGIMIEDPSCVQKSFPNFWDYFQALYPTPSQ